MIKNKIIIGLTIAGAVALTVASLAGAEGTVTTPVSTSKDMKMMVQIGPEGMTTLRGTLVSVNGNVLTVKSWGGNWTVKVASGSEVLHSKGGITNLSNFAAGDFVGVQGTADANAAWTINAKVVRDWTVKQTENTNKKSVQATEKAGRELGGKVFEGTASNVGANSFTLSAVGRTFTVNVVSSTSVINRNWLKISLSAVQNNDQVRVFGVADSGLTTIAAEVVRDVTLPVVSSSTAH